MSEGVAVDRLVRVGLTQYEARVYVALIRRDGSTAADMARLAGVPRPRIYDTLDSLVAKGLARTRPGHAAKYVAVDPAQAMARLVTAHRERLGLLEDDARAVAEELRPAFDEGTRQQDPMDYIEVIRDRDALLARFDKLQNSVTREMLAFSKEPHVVRVDHNLAGIEMASRGVVRSVYEFEILRDPVRREGVRSFIGAGEQARFVPELPMKLAIVDGHTVMFAMRDPVAQQADLTTVIVEHPQLAALLTIAFESVWATGLTLDDACTQLDIDRHF